MLIHSPGPFAFEPITDKMRMDGDIELGVEDAFWITGGDVDEVLATVHQPINSGDPEANARLFAAAPALLSALKDADNYLESALAPCEAGCDCIIHVVKAAIAKAEGRS